MPFIHLEQLIDLDMTTSIDSIPRVAGHQQLQPRTNEQYITFHYSAVNYADRSEAAERQRILDEAQYQINKNWAKPRQSPIYGDGLMYDFVVLTSGLIVRTRKNRQKLWHCNNVLGNSQSWSVHVMLGQNQDLSAAQRAGVFRLFDALRADSTILRSHVVGHCEWPLSNGSPVLTTAYAPRGGQSMCPGHILIRHIYAYRHEVDSSAANRSIRRYRVRSYLSSNPLNNYAAVRIAPNIDADLAMIDNNPVRLEPGRLVGIDAKYGKWLHIAEPAPWGWSHSSLFELD